MNEELKTIFNKAKLNFAVLASILMLAVLGKMTNPELTNQIFQTADQLVSDLILLFVAITLGAFIPNFKLVVFGAIAAFVAAAVAIQSGIFTYLTLDYLFAVLIVVLGFGSVVLGRAFGLGRDEMMDLGVGSLLHDVGKPRTRRFESDGRVSFHHHEVVGARMTRKRMQALRFSNELIDDVSTLVELHLRFHGYGTGEWTDSAVRRYVTDAGPLLPRLHRLTRADCTTRNVRKARRLAATYDDLESRIDALLELEELTLALDLRAILADLLAERRQT
mgnify:CR=1 FL=1